MNVELVMRMVGVVLVQIVEQMNVEMVLRLVQVGLVPFFCGTFS